MVACERCGLRFYCITRYFKICLRCEIETDKLYPKES
jgi:hypothetical protein